ncbi:formylglycine-generating enzyme family protein [Chlorobium sp. KB01]|uniref:formylglycine-generating enzyme family protein n=1 Tax=Chlorobium sp. KB01 TaxID=1917528 RepID=UPI000975A1A1|nr:formylglycine-generating enzyme family protein [Chlorobium sp. KB01]
MNKANPMRSIALPLNPEAMSEKRSSASFTGTMRRLLTALLARSWREGRVVALIGTLTLAGVIVFATTAFAVSGIAVPENFVLLPGGEFTMGSPLGEANRQTNETQHQVRLSDFYMSRYPVTFAEFRKFVKATGYLTDAEKANDQKHWRHAVSGTLRPKSEDNHPVVFVSWNDAVAYCNWISQHTGRKFRLPTEAEREYACRAGTTTPFNTGQNLTTERANYNGQNPSGSKPKGAYRENTVAVNSFAPNAWGLYNMHGNVWEWCSDWFDPAFYEQCKAAGTVTNPDGPEDGSRRVLRGASWFDFEEHCRSAYRIGGAALARNPNVGFRLVFVP